MKFHICKFNIAVELNLIASLIVVLSGTTLIHAQETDLKAIKLSSGSKEVSFKTNQIKAIFSRNFTDSLEQFLLSKSALYLTENENYLMTRPITLNVWGFGSNSIYSNSCKTYKEGYNLSLKIPSQNIESIKVTHGVEQTMNAIIGLSLTSALLVSPLTSLGKNFNSRNYYNIAGTSMAICGAAIGVNLILGERKYYLKGEGKRIWTVE